MTTPATFPQDFQVRPATLDDLEAVFQVMQVQEMADYGEFALALEELRASWLAQTPRLWVVLAPAGQIVAGGEIKTRPSIKASSLFVWVLPEYQGQGIGTGLLLLLESEARASLGIAALDAPERFFTQASGRNAAARRVLEEHDYTCSSVFQVMELAMAEPPPAPAALDGIEVRPFVVGQDEQAVYAADEEAFNDERGKMPRTFEVWSRRLGMGTPRFDPTLWYVAWDGDQTAATSMSELVLERQGELMHLGVRRPWRRRGLGMALLLRTLGELYRRGVFTVRLNVDAESLTNAQVLYARAGFQVINTFWNYEKAWH
jgi:mycothiol synthase